MKKVGGFVGWVGFSVFSVVLVFYSIVGGWIICFLLGVMIDLFGFIVVSVWLKGFSVECNFFGMLIFYVLMILIV